MTRAVERYASKVPEVTLVFWILKIAATTLGETGGDTVTMTLDWGYLVGTAPFLSLLIVFVVLQIASKKFHPFLYWATIIASTTAGTTIADFADRSLGIGYAGGSLLLFACLMATLGAWYWSAGSISVATVNTPKVETFYWLTITFSQTLGTALGDWTADDTGLGYAGGALLFAPRKGSRQLLTTLLQSGELPEGPILHGVTVKVTVAVPLVAPAIRQFRLTHQQTQVEVITAQQAEIRLGIAVFIVACILLLPQRAGEHPGRSETAT